MVGYRFVQPGYANGDFDSLAIYYRTDSTQEWQLMEIEEQVQGNWTEHVLTLGGIMSYDVQLAFEYRYGSGRGIGIDEVTIENVSDCFLPFNLRSVGMNDNSGRVSWQTSNYVPFYRVKISETPLADVENDVAIIDSTVYNPYIELSGLEHNRYSYVYVTSNCMDSGESELS